MEDIRIEHVESSVKKIEEENVGEFWFNINFPVNRFKEISQTRYTFKQPNNNHKHIVLQSKYGYTVVDINMTLNVSKNIPGL